MGSVMGFIHSTETFGTLDGPGIRYVVFLQGCPLQCLYCHNPDSWDLNDGTKKTAAEVMEDIVRYKTFISSGGVTISGGEPLMQPEFVSQLIDLGHANGLHMAIDTSGAVPLNTCEDAVKKADLLLLDIKSIDNQKCLNISGRGNLNTLEMLEYREKIGKPVWIRHVLVPGLTLVEEDLIKLAEHLKSFKCIEKIELLAFHKMGEYKWQELGRPYMLYDTPAPNPDEIEAARNIFIQRGLPVA